MAWICPPSSGQRIERSQGQLPFIQRGNHHGLFEKSLTTTRTPQRRSFDKGDDTVGTGMVGAGLRRCDELQIRSTDHGVIEDALQNLRLRFCGASSSS
jgi:hypothetical protein